MQPPLLEGAARAWGDRPLSGAALGLALGLLCGRLAPLPVWALAAAALLALGWALTRLEKPGLWPALFAAGLACGAARIQPLRAAWDAPLPPPQAVLRLDAQILSDEGARPAQRRHIFIVRAAQGDLRLSADMHAVQGWGPGDRIQAYGTLRVPKRPSNPGEFDYRRHLLGRGIVGSFSARQSWPATLTQRAPRWHLPRLLWQLRQRMVAGLDAGLSERALVLARGIVLGDKAGFTREDYSEYARSGFADILAVSGAHFTVALGLFLLLARLFTHSRRKQAVAGLVLGLAYALLTGFEAPVQRAFALFAVWLLARAFDWECEALVSLAFGALLILLAQPGALWEAGFQLSFFCTWAVLGLGPRLAQDLPPRWPGWLRVGLGAALAAQVALACLLAHHFHQLSWPSLLACVVSGLFTTAILGLGLPLGLLGPWAPWLGWPLERVLLLLDASAERMARWPWAAYSTGSIGIALLCAALLWAFFAAFYRGPWRRSALALGASALLTGLLWQGLPFQQRHPGVTHSWFLDVGQGDSLLLRFEDGRTLLADGGPALPDAGAWVVVPALRALGIQKLDWVLATHADADHVGGLAWALDQMPVGALLVNGQLSDSDAWAALMESARRRSVPIRSLGTQIPRHPDDGPWKVLHPSPVKPRKTKRPSKRPRRPDTNGASVVLRVEDWLLITGDLPKAGEKRLLKRGLRSVEVLKVGHHGSKGSTHPGFVGRLQPQHALIGCGAENWYGHPSAPALEALKGVTLWRTDLQGCIHGVKRAGLPVQWAPWRPADPQDLRRPRGAYRSPWRGLRPPKAPPNPPENEGESEDAEDGDAA